MRIDDSIKIDQISLQTRKAQLLPQSVPRRQTAAPLDSYSRSTESASIIDAEYVEIYSTSMNALPYKPSGILSDFGTDEVKQSSGGQQQRISRQNLVSRYQEMATDTTMPGTYLDIFA